MKISNSVPGWKDSSALEFTGLTLMIPLSVILFNVIIGFVFRGFTLENSESTLKILADVLYGCLGTAIAIYIYKFRKSYLIAICSFAVLFLVYVLLMLTFKPAPIGVIIEALFSELIWVYVALFSFIFFFRYSETKLDYAETKDVVEKTDKKTNLKYDTGICTKCGQTTLVAKERNAGGSKKAVFFCGHCGRFIKGNPLTGMVLGIVIVLISIVFIYGMNAGSQRSAGGAINLLFGIIFYLGVRSLYTGTRWTLKAAAKKDTHKSEGE